MELGKEVIFKLNNSVYLVRIGIRAVKNLKLSQELAGKVDRDIYGVNIIRINRVLPI